MEQKRATLIDYKNKCLIYELAHLSVCPDGTDTTEKDIDGFIKVL